MIRTLVSSRVLREVPARVGTSARDRGQGKMSDDDGKKNVLLVVIFSVPPLGRLGDDGSDLLASRVVVSLLDFFCHLSCGLSLRGRGSEDG